MRAIITSALLVVAILCCTSSSCEAETISYPIISEESIQNDLGETGVLLNFGVMDSLIGMAILYAKLHLSLPWDSCELRDRHVLVRVPKIDPSRLGFSSISAWDSSNAYLMEGVLFASSPSESQGRLVEILVNEIVQQWAEGSIATNGLLLTTRSAECSRFLNLDDSVQRSGFLEICYVRKSP